MVVRETAEGFRAAVSALQSFDESKGVNFHTFLFPEDCFGRLLVKNLGKQSLRVSSAKSWNT
jgi:hypothetical protein